MAMSVKTPLKNNMRENLKSRDYSSKVDAPSVNKICSVEKDKNIDNMEVDESLNQQQGKVRDKIYMATRLPKKAPHVSIFTNTDCVKDLKTYLDEGTFRRFCDDSTFGLFTQIHNLEIQAQFIRQFMSLEVHFSTKNSLICLANGKLIQFTPYEFCIITGLKVDSGDMKFEFDTDLPNKLLMKYFGGANFVYKDMFFEVFKSKVWGQDNDDAFKFALLYFIHSYILGGQSRSDKVTRLHFDLVDSGRYVDYAWGKDAFDSLADSINNGVGSKKFYTVNGMPLAMQVWLYECCCNLDPSFAIKHGQRIPRLLNWNSVKYRPFFDNLTNKVFNGEVVFNNIHPTDEEIKKLNLPSEYLHSLTHSPSYRSKTSGPSNNDFQETPPSNFGYKGKGVLQDESTHTRRRLVQEQTSEKRQKVMEPVAKIEKQTVRRSPRVQHVVAKGIDATKKGINIKLRSRATEKTNNIPPMRESDEIGISRKDFDEFKAEVRIEFADLKKLITALPQNKPDNTNKEVMAEFADLKKLIAALGEIKPENTVKEVQPNEINVEGQCNFAGIGPSESLKQDVSAQKIEETNSSSSPEFLSGYPTFSI